MARTKKYRPGKKKPAPRIPEAPAAPSQTKLDGFSSPELEALEGAIERFAIVQDRVKDQKKKLQQELDKEEAKLIEAMVTAGQDAIVIGGYTVSIARTIKAKVKGAPKKKSADEEDDDETRIEISHRGRTAGTTLGGLKEAAGAAAAG